MRNKSNVFFIYQLLTGAISVFREGCHASRTASAPMRYIATIGKIFLTCTGIALG
jgi:hypothetical protein